jgi:CheY-like chemotaxis protein
MDKTVNILLVEDDEIDVMGVRRAFRKLKIANPLTVAHNGLEALRILRGEDGHEAPKRPFMVLLDLNLPRMNGIEFLTELRRDPELHSTIVFVLTTSKDDEDRFAAYEFNVAGYMVKSKIGKDFMDLVSMLDHYWRVIEFP